MTKRDYILISDALARAQPRERYDAAAPSERPRVHAEWKGWARAVNEISKACKLQNSHFNELRFKMACNGKPT